jgi:hypothetical protein
MITVNVSEDGEELAVMKFDDRNMSFHIGDVEMVCHDAVAASAGATIWQRVAHAAMVAAHIEQGLDD